jgi:ppGpp synthetase/RelA/SpoT-type nucleotidyltranferase
MMKVLQSIGQVYDERILLYKKYKIKIDTLIKSNIQDKWHYESRIKEKESFALKIETGKVPNPANMEDLFACTIVVENINLIKEAIRIVELHFDIKYRKPEEVDKTIKNSDSFIFDDLRLYVSLKKDQASPVTEFHEIVFEIQIKTFLQHAWSIATHDLVYKSNKISWGKERVSFQIKAMLEHAEVSLGNIENLAESEELAKSNKRIIEIAEILNMLNEKWSEEDLPEDRVRMAENIRNLLEQFQLSLENLTEILDAETANNRGTTTKNLSPFMILLQSIISQNKTQNFRRSLEEKQQLNEIYIPVEINIE